VSRHALAGARSEIPLVRITPLDIQKHRFRRTFRGYDPKEVRAFLLSFAEQYELVVRENGQHREQVAALREQLREHEERERVLKDTLLAAQAAADQLRAAARRDAEIIVKEAEVKAEKMMEVARERVARTESRLVDLRSLRRELLEQVRGMLTRQGALLADWEESEEVDNLKFMESSRRLARPAE
jgi:cell division initiation protein